MIELSPINGSAELSVKWTETGVETANYLSGTRLKNSCSKIFSIVHVPEKINYSTEMRLGERSLECVSTRYSSLIVAWNRSMPNISCKISMPIE